MSKRGAWGSKLGFILAASGSAVGLGNIWRFPYITGKSGGAIFVLIYLGSVILIGLPLIIAEVTLGRFTRQNPVGAFNAIRPRTPWTFLGYAGVLTGVMILSYYSVIAGWTVGYIYKSLAGQFTNITSGGAESLFTSFCADSLQQILLLAIFMCITVYIVSKGVSAGIEKFSKILMPALVGIMLILVARSVTLPGAMKGLEFYLYPDFSKLSIQSFMDSMGQALFSLSLGMGTMITYGSYFSKKENIPVSTAWVALFDTAIAITAGFIIFPALFSQGMNPAEGPGLVFNILPVIFAKMPGGVFFGALFFVLLCIAALTSTISLLEVPVAYFLDQKKWNRTKASWLIGGVAFLMGIPSALAAGGSAFFTNLPLLHMDFLTLWDRIWGNYSLSLGAFFLAIFVGYTWKTGNALKEITTQGQTFKLGKFWVIAVKYISPLLILLILISLILKNF